MRATILIFLFFVTMAIEARGELLVTKDLPHVGPNKSGIIVLQTGSAKVGAHVVYEDPENKQTRVIGVVFGSNGQGVTPSWTSKLINQAATQVGGVGKLLKQIALDGFTAEQSLTPDTLKHPIFTYRIYTNLETARNAEKAILSAHVNDESFSFREFNNRTISLLRSLLLGSEVTRNSSGGELPPLPVAQTNFATPLSFLFANALELDVDQSLKNCAISNDLVITQEILGGA